jgi:hypothetical protein
MRITLEATSCVATRYFPSIFWSLKVNYAFARDLHMSPSSARPIHPSKSHPISPRSNLILSNNYIAGFLVVSFLLALPSITPSISSSLT